MEYPTIMANCGAQYYCPADWKIIQIDHPWDGPTCPWADGEQYYKYRQYDELEFSCWRDTISAYCHLEMILDDLAEELIEPNEPYTPFGDEDCEY